MGRGVTIDRGAATESDGPTSDNDCRAAHAGGCGSGSRYRLLAAALRHLLTFLQKAEDRSRMGVRQTHARLIPDAAVAELTDRDRGTNLCRRRHDARVAPHPSP